MTLNLEIENFEIFKTIITILEKILSDVSLEFRDNKFFIASFDNSQSVLINARFANFKNISHADNLLIGLNLSNFVKVLKFVDREYSLKMMIEDTNNDTLILRNNTKSVYKLKLVEPQRIKTDISKIVFDVIITILKADLLKLCQEIAQIAENVEIKCKNNTLTFICHGDIYYETNYAGKEVSILYTNEQKEITGLYEIKNIILFSKCISMCENVQIYMKHEGPIGIKYIFNKYDKLTTFFSPISTQGEFKDFNDADYDDDDDEIKFKV